jgi:hypothetical protein
MSGCSACTTDTSLACWRSYCARVRAALGGEAAAVAVAVEQVVQVEAGDAQVTRHLGNVARTRGLAYVEYFRQLQAELAAALVEYAGGADEHAAGAQGLFRAQAMREEPQVARVLAAARVVEQQLAARVVRGDALRLRPRWRQFGRLEQALAKGGADLAVARHALVAGYHQRRVDAQAHAPRSAPSPRARRAAP